MITLLKKTANMFKLAPVLVFVVLIYLTVGSMRHSFEKKADFGEEPEQNTSECGTKKAQHAAEFMGDRLNTIGEATTVILMYIHENSGPIYVGGRCKITVYNNYHKIEADREEEHDFKEEPWKEEDAWIGEAKTVILMYIHENSGPVCVGNRSKITVYINYDQKESDREEEHDFKEEPWKEKHPWIGEAKNVIEINITKNTGSICVGSRCRITVYTNTWMGAEVGLTGLVIYWVGATILWGVIFNTSPIVRMILTARHDKAMNP